MKEIWALEVRMNDGMHCRIDLEDGQRVEHGGVGYHDLEEILNLLGNHSSCIDVYDFYGKKGDEEWAPEPSYD